MARSSALEQHGVQGYNRGCRCPRCRLARSSYDQVWNCARAVERGARPQWRVPTGRARDHVLALRAAGLSVEEIARRAQLGSATVWRLLREDRAYNTTVAALLRVRA